MHKINLFISKLILVSLHPSDDPRHFWEVLNNWGIAGQGWNHPTAGITLRHITYLVTAPTKET